MLAAEKSVFMFALGRERIEADQDIVDEAGMTHDEAAFRQPIEKLLHQRAEVRRLIKIIGAGESGIERNTRARGAAAKLCAQDVENQSFGSAEPAGQRLIAPALADPGFGRSLLHRRQKRVAHPGKQLRMLVGVDKVRRAAEQFVESRKLHPQFRTDDLGIEPVEQARAQQFRKRQKHAAIDRLKVHRQGSKRRGQSGVQADRAAGAACNGGAQRAGFVAADRGPDHHHRCRIDAAALDQVADAAVDAGTETVVVGAQPDAARRHGDVHSAAVRSVAPVPVSASLRFSLCSATK